MDSTGDFVTKMPSHPFQFNWPCKVNGSASFARGRLGKVVSNNQKAVACCMFQLKVFRCFQQRAKEVSIFLKIIIQAAHVQGTLNTFSVFCGCFCCLQCCFLFILYGVWIAGHVFEFIFVTYSACTSLHLLTFKDLGY